MSVLFFDGFDRYTVTKKLDPNHWSYQPGQPLEYEKYAFGGYSYNHAVNNYPSLSYYSEGYGEGYNAKAIFSVMRLLCNWNQLN